MITIMNDILERLARQTLLEHDLVSQLDRRSAKHEEFTQLRQMRENGEMPMLAARVLLLVTAGWKRAEIAEALDVSRVTVNTWLREHTRGENTFDGYNDLSYVMSPVVDELSAHAKQQITGLRFVHDKFIVPSGFQPIIEALWRVAYRARGHEITVSSEIAAAGDALDVMISILLRRGVTNIAIARAAGVTHRAVLDRIERARQRGLLLQCSDDTCESFYGERELYDSWSSNTVNYEDAQWKRFPAAPEISLVQLTSARPSRYWLQTLASADDNIAYVLHAEEVDDPRAHLAAPDVARYLCYGELQLAGALARMSEDSPVA